MDEKSQVGCSAGTKHNRVANLASTSSLCEMSRQDGIPCIQFESNMVERVARMQVATRLTGTSKFPSSIIMSCDDSGTKTNYNRRFFSLSRWKHGTKIIRQV